MTYKEAQEKLLSSRWKTETCSAGEKCWCRMIVPEKEITYDEIEEMYVAGQGEIHKAVADHIVKTHNIYLDIEAIKQMVKERREAEKQAK